MKKTWLYVFLSMFLVPEILFFTTPSLIRSLCGKSFSELSSLVVNYTFFLQHPSYLLAIIIVELIGALGLAIVNFKSSKLLFFLALIILVWLALAFCITYLTAFLMGF